MALKPTLLKMAMSHRCKTKVPLPALNSKGPLRHPVQKPQKLLNLGHLPPRLLQAAKRAMNRLWTMRCPRRPHSRRQ